MSYTVLARKYRSTTFDEIIGQNHVSQTLKKAIESGRIAHAFLFCGTRGTGKTSMARIMAKALNCEKSDGPTTKPCGKCDLCKGVARGDDIDVIEIDAASNTQVEKTREIIDNAQYRPMRCRFKIYIIDEVHMLSKSSFNALLKTLEEPPEHVKFILATTEPEKVLPTILSRCQRYDFRNIPTREIAGHLKEICKEEKIKADEDALLLVAKAGAGSMRDSLSLLDRLLSLGEKTLDVGMIEQLLGLPKSQLIFNLSQSIGEGDVKRTLQQADDLINNGLSQDMLVASLVDHLRNLLILRTCGKESRLVEVPGMPPADLEKQAGQFDPAVMTQDIVILEDLRRQMRQSQAGRALLDATLVRLAMAEQFTSVGELLNRVNGGAGAPPAQKKKFDGVVPHSPSPLEGEGRGEGEDVRSAVGQNSQSAALTQTGAASQSIAKASIPHPSPLPQGERGQDESPSTTSATDDTDDDLPQPGRVWTGPSLKELLAQQSAVAASMKADVPASPSSDGSNVESVDPANLPGVWQALLNLLSEKGMGLAGAVSHGRLVGLDDGTARIRFSRQHDTFVRMFEKNGKKEAIRDAFSQVLQQTVGVAFEVDGEGGSTAVATAAPIATASQSRPGVVRREVSPEPDAPAAQASARLTPELRESAERDPLVRAILEQLGGTVVKVE
jgi:DNA polymerase-3 subunit gamma/tau